MAKKTQAKKVEPRWTITDQPITAFNIKEMDFDPSEDSRVNQHWNDLLNRMLVGESPTRDDFFLCLGVIREHADGYRIKELLERIDQLDDQIDDYQGEVSNLEEEISELKKQLPNADNTDFADFVKGATK